MAITPTILEKLARARADLRGGVPVVLFQGAGAVLAVAAETLDQQTYDDICKIGQPYVVLTQRRAETLKARCYDGDIARIAIPPDGDLAWVSALADPADDLRVPFKGPLSAMRGGDAALSRGAISLIKEARLLPAALVVDISGGAAFAASHDLTAIDLDAATPHLAATSPMHRVVCAHVPLAVSQAGRLHVFRPDDGSEEHYAVEIGQPDRTKPVLARLHSACFTGDLLGSLKCDCGPQLHAALHQMGDQGAGILLYLNQEGRGIGLANKMRAYSLQDQGFDTVEANHRLGFEDDERDFRIGANILKEMGFSSVRLLTNNPAKVAMMRENGVEVTQRVPLKVGENPLNSGYLDTKAKKSGHLL